MRSRTRRLPVVTLSHLNWKLNDLPPNSLISLVSEIAEGSRGVIDKREALLKDYRAVIDSCHHHVVWEVAGTSEIEQ